jgi:hypothetical protein
MMTDMRKIRAAFFLLGACVFAQSPDLMWITLPDPRLEVNGLPWYGENGGELYRFPLRLKDSLPKAVWSLVGG